MMLCSRCKAEHPGPHKMCRECLDKVSEWKRKNPWLRQASNWRYNYGVDVHEALDALQRQNYLCGICGEKETSATGKPFSSTRHLALDHDHKTGKFRGFLCTNCNRALGMFKDSIIKLRSAIKYLERTRAEMFTTCDLT